FLDVTKRSGDISWRAFLASERLSILKILSSVFEPFHSFFLVVDDFFLLFSHKILLKCGAAAGRCCVICCSGSDISDDGDWVARRCSSMSSGLKDASDREPGCWAPTEDLTGFG